MLAALPRPHVPSQVYGQARQLPPATGHLLCVQRHQQLVDRKEARQVGMMCQKIDIKLFFGEIIISLQ